MLEELDYDKKLRIFHDTFVKYTWSYLEYQKAIENKQEVPAMTTPFRDKLAILRCIPIVKDGVDIVSCACELWSGRLYEVTASISINKIFPSSGILTVQLLSKVIQKVAIYIEDKLNQFQTQQEIGAFATAAAVKLISSLKKIPSSEVSVLTSGHLIDAIINKDGWFISDAFSILQPQESKNYHFISLTELKEYIEERNIDKAEGIFAEIESSAILANKIESLSAAVITDFCEHIRTTSNLPDSKQIILLLEGLTLPSGYIVLDLMPFNTDIDSLRIGRLEAKIDSQQNVKLHDNAEGQEMNFDNVRGGINSFVGRESQLNCIYEYFTSNEGAIQIIGGLVGVGKTQTALRYANDHKEEYNYRVRLIAAESESSLESSFREFAEDLSINIRHSNSKKVIQLVLDKLEKQLSKSLIIFDNAMDKRSLTKYLPSLKALKKHHIIITTTNMKDWEDSAPSKECNSLKLLPFSEQESIEYTAHTLKDYSIENVRELAQLFSYIPLGFAQSIAFIRSSEISIDDYLTEYKQKRASQLHVNMHDLSLEDDSEFAHVSNIYTSLAMVLERIIVSTPNAYKVIKLCSYLRAESIPLNLFDRLFLYKSEISRVMSVLKGYSILSIRTQKNHQFIDMHRIFQEVTMMQVSIEEKINDIKGMALYIVQHKLFTRDNTIKQKHESNKEYIAHVESIIEKAREYNIELNVELTYLELSIAVYYDFNRDHQKANDRLLALKKSLDDLVGITDDMPAEKVTSLLADRFNNLPTIYSQICYHLGKTYLSLWQELTISNELEQADLLNKDALKEFETAITIRHIIDDSPELYDDSFNEGEARPMDSIIFQRQGILLWYQLQKHVESLEKALGGYRELIELELLYSEDKRDNFNLETCRRLSIECMSEILDATNSKDIELDLNILDNIRTALGIAFQGSFTTVDNRILLAEELYKALELKTEEFVRIGRNYNLVGKIFLKIYSTTHVPQDLELSKKFILRAKELEESENRQSFILEDANKLLDIIHDLENPLKLELKSENIVGALIEGDQVTTILQAIKEKYGEHRVEFTASLTEENVTPFIERITSPHEIKKIQFATINIYLESSEGKRIDEHWVSYVQIPNVEDANGSVVSVRSIIINSAGDSYSQSLNRLKHKIEDIFLEKQIQITLPVQNLDYQKRDLELYQDWNTCGVWVCNFFEELVSSVITLENFAQLKFDEILSYTNISERRREYSDLLKALDLSLNTKDSENDRTSKDEISADIEASTISREKQFEELLGIIKLNSYPPILEPETPELEKIRYAKLISSFTQLGEMFIQRVEEENLIENRIKALIEASKFFNYAIIIAKKHNLDFSKSCSKLEYINSELILMSEGTILPTQLASTNSLKDNSEILELRDFSREKLGDLESLSDKDTVIRTRELFENISERMTGFLARLFQESEAILGEPPCKYSVMGLGSMALKTITPYSDLEFAIIIERNTPEIKEYFKKLTQLVHFRVINLGETVIPASHLGDCNTDHLITKGVSFDLGKKTPLGNEDKYYDLIQTIDGMMSYLRNEGDKIEHIDKNLPYILEISAYVYGDLSLYQEYVEQSQYFLFNEANSEGIPNHELRAIKRLRDGVVEYDYYGTNKNNDKCRLHLGDIEIFAPTILEPNKAENLFNVKHEIYRVADRLLYDLALLYGCKITSIWDIGAELLKRYNDIKVDYKSIEYLNSMLICANNLRIRTYLKYNAQKEDIYIFDYRALSSGLELRSTDHNKHTLFYFSEEDIDEEGALFQFFYISMSVYRFLSECLSADKKNYLIEEFLSKSDYLYDDGLIQRGMIYFRLGMYEKAKNKLELAIKDENLSTNDRGVLATLLPIIYINCDELEKLEELYKVTNEKYYSLIQPIESRVSKAIALRQTITVYPPKGDSNLDYRPITIIPGVVPEHSNVQNVLKLVCRAIGEDSHIENLDSSAVLRAKGNHLAAIELNLLALKYETNDQQRAGILNELGLSYQENKNFDKAIEYHYQSIELRKRIYGEVSLDVANSLNSLGYCYNHIDQDKSLRCYERAAEIQQIIYEGRPHKDTITSLKSIGFIYQDKERFDKAIAIFERCYTMCSVLHNGVAHPEICEIIDSLAHTYFLQGDYVTGLGTSLQSYKILFSFLAKNTYQSKNTGLILANNLIGFCDQFFLDRSAAKEVIWDLLKAGEEFIEPKMYFLYANSYYENNKLDMSIVCLKMFLAYKRGQHEDIKNIALNNLARIYHIKALYEITNGDGNSADMVAEYFSFACAHFEIALEGEGIENKLRIEYASLLILFEKYEEASELILDVLLNDADEDVLSYTEIEYPILIDELQSELIEKERIEVSSIELAYFLIIRYYKEFQNSPDIKSKEEYLYRFGWFLETEQSTIVGKHLLESLLNDFFSRQIEERMQEFHSYLAEHGDELREALGIDSVDNEENSIDLSELLTKAEVIELVNIIKENIYPPILDKETPEEEKTRYEKLASSFTQIGEVFIREADDKSVIKESRIQVLIEASKFLNYAISIAIGKDINSSASSGLLEYINSELLFISEAINIPYRFMKETTKKDKLILTAIRNKARERIAEIETLSVVERIEKTRALFEIIAASMQEFLARLFQESEAILGASPCGYAVVGLGSMALKTITPYSDLEFAIIIEKDSSEIKDYFKKLTQLVHFRIINLGETVIPSSYLGECNTDHLITKGVSFDLGKKTPLGNEDKHYDLIQTIDGMLHYLRNENDEIEHIDKNLPYILEISDYIYGDLSLHQAYLAQVHDFLFEETNSEGRPHHEVRAINRLKGGELTTHSLGDLEKFKPDILSQGKEGKTFDIKQEIYRLPDRLIYNIALFYGIKLTNLWSIVDLLSEEEIIPTADTFQKLQKVISDANSLRLANYLKLNSQQTHIPQEDHLLADDELFEFYYTILPLYQKIDNFCSCYQELTLQQKRDFFQPEDFYDNNSANRGFVYYRLARYDEAIEFLEKADIEFTDQYSTQILNVLSTIYLRLGAYDQALQYSKRSLEKQKILHNDQPHEDIAGYLYNIATIYRAKGEYEFAEQYHQDSLKMRRELYGEEGNLEIADSLNGLGILCSNKGEFDRAIEFFEESIEIIRELSDNTPSHSIIVAISGLGNIHYTKGDFKIALKYHIEALELKRALYQNTIHVEIASSLNNIANIYSKLGDFKKAIKLYKESLNIKNIIYKDPTTSDIADTYNNLGELHRDIGDFATAVSYLTKSLEIKTEIYQNDGHPSIAASYNGLGNVYLTLQDFDQAIEYYNKSLKMKEDFYEGFHHEMIPSLIGLGNAYGGLRKYDEAIKYFEEVLEKGKGIYGVSDNPGFDYYVHLDTVMALNNIGNIIYRKGDFEGALEHYSQSLRMQRFIFKEAINSNLAHTINNIGACHQELGDSDKAIEYYTQSLEMRRAVYQDIVEYHSEIADSLGNLGKIYRQIGEIEKSNECYQECHQIRKHIKGFPSKEGAIALTNIAINFKESKDILKAMIYVHKAWREILQIKNNEGKKFVLVSLEEIAKEFSMHFQLDPKTVTKMFIDLGFQNKDIENPELYFFKAISSYKSHNLMEAINAYELTLIFIAEGNTHAKITIYHNLASMYHSASLVKIKEENYDLANEYFNRAIFCFEKAIEISGTNIKQGLSIEYANFLIEHKNFIEAAEYLLKAISVEDDGSGLCYEAIDKESIAKVLKNKIESTGKSISVIPKEYAYYLLTHHYEEFSQVAELKTQEEYLQEFRKTIGSSMGYYMYGQIISEKQLENDVFLSTSDGLKFLSMAEQVLSEESFKKFIDFCSDKHIDEQTLSESDAQKFEILFNLLLETQENPNTDSIVLENQGGDVLLETIDKIKDFVGEKELSELPGFYQYVFNALSNNHFSKSATQVLDIVGNLIASLEKLMDISLHIPAEEIKESEDIGTSLWSQLEDLLEFVGSGQRFLGAPKPPYFDPGDDGFGGGSSSGGSTGRGNENITEPMLLSLNGTISSNNTFENDI